MAFCAPCRGAGALSDYQLDSKALECSWEVAAGSSSRSARLVPVNRAPEAKMGRLPAAICFGLALGA